MISKLRKKIIAINVISVCIVFFIAEVVTFAINFNRIDNERNTRIFAALDFDYVNETYEENAMFNDIALIVYDTEQDKVVYSAQGADAKVTQGELDSQLPRMVNSELDHGLINPSIKYRKVVDGNLVKIAISDTYLGGRDSTRFLLSGGGTLLFAIACYFIISVVLSRIALKPIEETWEKQKQFVADASHELKTPLSVIMANTEIIASHKEATVESQMKWLDNTKEESNRMAGLVADLLFLAKDDDGLKVQMDVVNMSDCMETQTLSYDAVFYENGKDFRYEIGSNIKVKGNEGQLKQLVTILLDNANKYSVGRGNILLTLTATGKKVTLCVSNDSEALTEENIAHLFDRFYTVDKSRNTDKGGNGLGLSIAKTICVNHGGDLNVSYNNGRT
ncbi:MAG: HAMP domain-containing histidine kinase, partial [Clostridia bacterium]|nr:HAMP domain-containing histidine kinase [Clostridia bacterium]